MENCLKDLEYFSNIHKCLVLGEIVGIEDEDSYLMRNNDDGIEEICESKSIRKITNISPNPLSEGTCEYIKGNNQFLEVDIKEKKGLFYLLEVENEESMQTILSRQKQLRYIEFTPIEDYIDENYTNVIISMPPELGSWVNTDRFKEVLNTLKNEDSSNGNKLFVTCFPRDNPTSLRVLCNIDQKEIVKLMLTTAIEKEKELSTICQDKENSKKQLEEVQKKNKNFFISSKFVGLIIGSQGSNIKNLKTKYNVNIIVDSKKVNDKNESKVIITGDNGDNVEACYKEINITQKIYELPEGVEYELKKKASKLLEEYKIKSFKISNEEIKDEEGNVYKAPNVTILGFSEYIENLYINELKDLNNYGGSNSNHNYTSGPTFRGKGKGYNNYNYKQDNYKYNNYHNNYGHNNYYYKK